MLAVFQSPLPGLRFQVALPAEAACARSGESSVMSRRDGRDGCDFISSDQEKKHCGMKQNLPLHRKIAILSANGRTRPKARLSRPTAVSPVGSGI